MWNEMKSVHKAAINRTICLWAYWLRRRWRYRNQHFLFVRTCMSVNFQIRGNIELGLRILVFFLLRQERSSVEVLAARLYILQSWRHKAIWLESSTADLCTHNVWTTTLARTHACNCKLYACKSLCIYFSLNVIYLCWLYLALQKYALFNVF